jgi:hypothetical protein
MIVRQCLDEAWTLYLNIFLLMDSNSITLSHLRSHPEREVNCKKFVASLQGFKEMPGY